MSASSLDPDTSAAVMGVGLPKRWVDVLQRVLVEAQLPASLLLVDALDGALAHLWEHPVNCVLMATSRHGPSWSEASIELRRAAPAAFLVAVREAGASDPGRFFDDQLLDSDLEPRLLERVLRSAVAVAVANQRLVRWALRDPLTHTLNRRGLDRALQRETAARARGLGPLSALLIDCDDFKRVNDAFGMVLGDAILQQVARVLSGAVRLADTVARVGGDEFLILLPQTRTWEAVEIAERIRQQVPDEVQLPDGTPLSVSIGVQRLDDHVSTVTEVLAATQQGLHVSKAAGKDRIHVVGTGGAETTGSFSIPPGAGPGAFRSHAVHRHGFSDPVGWIVRAHGTPQEREALAAQRAAHPDWDCRWLRLALRDAEPSPLPVHVRVYPSTLIELGVGPVLKALPDWVRPEQLVLAVDELFMSGDPASLRPTWAHLKAHGVGLCIDISDFSRACLESMVVLKPTVVRSESSMVDGAGSLRAGAAGYRRFVEVCRGLAVPLIASWGPRTTPADQAGVRSLGVEWTVDLREWRKPRR